MHEDTHWKPNATLDILRLRAHILATIRDFFSKRGVMEVETPILSAATVTDPHLHSMTTDVMMPGHSNPQTFYLQTSPEYAMKRLLAAGSGSIYQLSKAFRNEEAGIWHNPEFTMLEWYRVGFDHHALMTEMDDFLQITLNLPPAERRSYAEIFDHYLAIDPHTASTEQLKTCAMTHAIQLSSDDIEMDRDAWLYLLLSHLIEPKLGHISPTFIYDFPASQAALARVRPGLPQVAERFEVYVKGIELANGYHELADAHEQTQRFISDLKTRQRLHYPEVKCDQRLISALSQGFPDCAGVALGVDRLILLASKASRLSDVLSFSITRA